MAFNDKYIFSASFEKQSSVSVAFGNFTIGEIFLSRGEYQYTKKSFDLHSSQLYEFLLLMKHLGTQLSKTSSEKVKHVFICLFFVFYFNFL